MKNLISSLGVISTFVIVLVAAALLTGKADLKFNMNSGEKGVAEESKDLPNQFFITKEVAALLNKEYQSSDKEYAACLKANQIVTAMDATIKISYVLTGFDTNIRFFGESFSQIDYCDGGMVHSHPKGTCYFSVADIYSFKDRIQKGEYFSVLVCGVDDFRYITRNDFTERKLEVEE
ncbi:MAG: hypothetical protein ACP5N3_03705 [Candidatus Nanoarchaeia archaeon]